MSDNENIKRLKKAKKVKKPETSDNAEKVKKGEKIEYHYGFYAAVNFQYEAMHDKMTFLQEYELGDEPVRIDMLIINDDAVLTDPIGSFFRKYNVLEYKSPRDSLSIDDFYKVQGYACLYKSSGKKVDDIPVQELTVSIFRHTYPVKMFKDLKNLGFCIKEIKPGIYYVTGALCVPVQVVVTSKLSHGGYEALKILAKNADRDDIVKFLQEINKSPSVNASAILRVSAAANEILYETLRKENFRMGAVERIFREEFSAVEERGMNKGISIGIDKGISIGINKGRAEGRAEERKLIRERMLEAGMSPQEVDKITN